LCRHSLATNDSAALRSFHRKQGFHEKILQKRMMCEVCEAESTSGGVSSRVDVVGVAERISTTSFRRFSSVAKFGTFYFLLKIKILAKRERELTTKFAIARNGC
jgi:hypothetical protein